MHADFIRVNDILISKLNGLQDILGKASSRMAFVDRIGISLDERIMQMVIGNARDRAWNLAVDLTTRSDESQQIILDRDRETAELGTTILGGNTVVRFLGRLVSRTEPQDVTVAIAALA